MAVSSLPKDVATRLFRMLAVNEQSATAVKRDHASYAKLSLLTEQMNMVQQQAQRTVEKSEAKGAKQARIDEVDAAPGGGTLALSSEYDEGAKRLLSMITVDESTVLTVARDTSACAKLSVLAEQVGLLQAQAQQCIDEADLNRRLTELGATVPGTRLVPGTVYYHYTQNGKEVISRIASDEWRAYDEYHGKFLYDFDFTFRKLTADGLDVLSGAVSQSALLLQRACEVKATGAAADGAERPAETPTGATPVCPVLSRW